MRVFGAVFLAGVLLTNVAQAQTIIRTMPPGVVMASDLDGPYGYDDLGPPPPAYGPRAYGPPPSYEPTYAPAVLPLHEVYRIVRENGFSPLGAPQQRGAVCTIAVLDPDGEDGRLVIDARSGRIIRFMPAYRYGARRIDDVNVAYGPPSPMPRPPGSHHPSACLRTAPETAICAAAAFAGEISHDRRNPAFEHSARSRRSVSGGSANPAALRKTCHHASADAGHATSAGRRVA